MTLTLCHTSMFLHTLEYHIQYMYAILPKRDVGNCVQNKKAKSGGEVAT